MMYSLVISPINGFLNQLASHITQEELSQMKFLLEDAIPAGELEQCATVRDLFTKLKKRCLIGEHNLEALEDLFNNMNLYKLTEKVQEFRARISRGAVKDIPKEQLYGENRTLPGNVCISGRGTCRSIKLATIGGGTCLKLNCQYFKKRRCNIMEFLFPQTCRLEDEIDLDTILTII